MTLFQYVVIALALVNFGIYISAGRSFFVATHAKAPSYVFVVSYLLLFCATMFGLVFHVQHSWPLLTASFAVLLVSLYVFFSAKKATAARPFTVVFSPDLPEHLVTNGIYHYIRHPFYSAYLATFFACALASSSVLTWISTLVITVAYTLAAKFEEKKFASSKLRISYESYRGHAGLFLPKLATRAVSK